MFGIEFFNEQERIEADEQVKLSYSQWNSQEMKFKQITETINTDLKVSRNGFFQTSIPLEVKYKIQTQFSLILQCHFIRQGFRQTYYSSGRKNDISINQTSSINGTYGNIARRIKSFNNTFYTNINLGISYSIGGKKKMTKP